MTTTEKMNTEKDLLIERLENQRLLGELIQKIGSYQMMEEIEELDQEVENTKWEIREINNQNGWDEFHGIDSSIFDDISHLMIDMIEKLDSLNDTEDSEEAVKLYTRFKKQFS